MVKRCLLVLVVLAGCEAVDRRPVVYRECFVPVRVVAVTDQAGSIGEDWTTTIELPDGTRRVWNYCWGQVGDEFHAWVRASELGLLDCERFWGRTVVCEYGKPPRIEYGIQEGALK